MNQVWFPVMTLDDLDSRIEYERAVQDFRHDDGTLIVVERCRRCFKMPVIVNAHSDIGRRLIGLRRARAARQDQDIAALLYGLGYRTQN